MQIALKVILLGVFAAGMAGIGAAVGSRTIVADVVRAEQFVLQGENGEPRAILAITEDGHATFSLLNDLGVPRLSLSVGGAGDGFSQISLADSSGDPRMILTVDPVGTPDFLLSDDNAKQRVKIGVYQDGRPFFAFSGSDGAPKAIAMLSSESSNFMLYVRDATNTLRAKFGLSGNASIPSMSMFDSQGKPRAIFVVSSDGHPGILLLDEDGKTTWGTPK